MSVNHIQPHIQQLLRDHGGRVLLDDGVEYLRQNCEPEVIVSIEREALRDALRAGFRAFNDGSSRQDNVPMVLSVGGGEYVMRPMATLDEKLGWIRKYADRANANRRNAEVIARETLVEYGDIVGIRTLVLDALNGTAEAEAA